MCQTFGHFSDFALAKLATRSIRVNGLKSGLHAYHGFGSNDNFLSTFL